MGLLEFIKDSWNGVKHGVSNLTTNLISGATAVYNEGKSAVTALHTDIKDLAYLGAKTVEKEWNTVETIGTRLIDKGSSTIESLGQSLSLPLVIGAALLGGILLLKK